MEEEAKTCAQQQLRKDSAEQAAADARMKSIPKGRGNEYSTTSLNGFLVCKQAMAQTVAKYSAVRSFPKAAQYKMAALYVDKQSCGDGR